MTKINQHASAHDGESFQPINALVIYSRSRHVKHQTDFWFEALVLAIFKPRTKESISPG